MLRAIGRLAVLAALGAALAVPVTASRAADCSGIACLGAILADDFDTLPPTPTIRPSLRPLPTIDPTIDPSVVPTIDPTVDPSAVPTVRPSLRPLPSLDPSMIPTLEPTIEPTIEPSLRPICWKPDICTPGGGLDEIVYRVCNPTPTIILCNP